jgi:energy-coupling factor transport system ATP-binding protein
LAIVEHTGHRSLVVDAGEIVSILGAPGSGKSQLAQELAFLRRPEEGVVLFHGKNPMERRSFLEPAPRPKEVTLLVQNAEDQLFAKTVFDDVSFGPRHLRLSEDEIEVRVLTALEAVRLDPAEVRDRSPFALSGGERRRVALAGVLAMEPEVLVLDEPTANLDPRTRNEFLDLLAPLRGHSAIVWLTSSAREAELANRVYLLRNGTTEEVPGGDRLLDQWRMLADAGIELPPVYELARSLEQLGESLPDTGSTERMKTAIITDWRERNGAR